MRKIKYNLLWVICIFLFSCKTVKYVEKEVVKTDSSVIVQNQQLHKILKETIDQYEKQKEQWLNTGVLFDTVYRDTGSLKIVPKVIFDNGKIKSIEGRLLAVNQQFFDKSSELLSAHSTIDSMAVELERRDIALSKKQETVIKEVRRTAWPWWLFIICFIGGLFIEYRFNIIKRILSLLKLKL